MILCFFAIFTVNVGDSIDVVPIEDGESDFVDKFSTKHLILTAFLLFHYLETFSAFLVFTSLKPKR